MSNKFKFIVLFVLVSSLAIVEMYFDSQKSLDFKAEGVVIEAQWNTANHNMPLFIIEESGGRKSFHRADIILLKEHIKIGDRFQKHEGSKFCHINGVRIQCIR